MLSAPALYPCLVGTKCHPETSFQARQKGVVTLWTACTFMCHRYNLQSFITSTVLIIPNNIMDIFFIPILLKRRPSGSKVMETFKRGPRQSFVHGPKRASYTTKQSVFLFSVSRLTLVLPRVVVTTPLTVCLRSHKNAKESDPGHLGHLFYILCGHLRWG